MNRWLGPLLIAIGVVFLALAVTYFTVKAQSLPGFMGWIPGSDVIRWKRGLGCLVVSLGFLIFGIAQVLPRRSRP